VPTASLSISEALIRRMDLIERSQYFFFGTFSQTNSNFDPVVEHICVEIYLTDLYIIRSVLSCPFRGYLLFRSQNEY